MTPDLHVEWRPYDFRVEVFEEDEEPYSFLTKLPSICSREREYWFAHVPLIYYQVVEHYYPGRVMRQFGMAQYFSVPDPITNNSWYDIHQPLCTTVMKDWRTEHAENVQRLEAMSSDDMVPDIYQIYAFEEWDQQYRQWYQENCAFTVYMFDQMSEINKKPLHVLMNIKQVLRVARYGITRGWKKLGKILLCTCAPPVVVAGYKDQLDKIRRLTDLLRYEDLDKMDDNDSAEQMSTPKPNLSEILSAPTADATFQQFGDRVGDEPRFEQTQQLQDFEFDVRWYHIHSGLLLSLVLHTR